MRMVQLAAYAEIRRLGKVSGLDVRRLRRPLEGSIQERFRAFASRLAQNSSLPKVSMSASAALGRSFAPSPVQLAELGSCELHKPNFIFNSLYSCSCTTPLLGTRSAQAIRHRASNANDLSFLFPPSSEATMADPEQQEDSEMYEPQDAVAKFTRGALVVGSAGFLLSAVQNTVAKHNVGALGVVTRFGGTTAIFGTVGSASDQATGG